MKNWIIFKHSYNVYNMTRQIKCKEVLDIELRLESDYYYKRLYYLNKWKLGNDEDLRMLENE